MGMAGSDASRKSGIWRYLKSLVYDGISRVKYMKMTVPDVQCQSHSKGLTEYRS